LVTSVVPLGQVVTDAFEPLAAGGRGQVKVLVDVNGPAVLH
jgi:hypothetical protein